MNVADWRHVAGTRAIFDLARRDRRAFFNGERLKRATREAQLDAVVAVSPVNVTYTAGAWVPLPLLYAFVVTTASDGQGVVINEADAYYLGEYSWVEDIRGFRFGPESDAAALSLLDELLGDLGLRAGTLGIELGYMPHRAFAQLAEALPRVEWRDATPVFEEARLVKTEAEIDLFRMAANCTARAIETAFALAAPGDTERELASEIQAHALRLGADALAHAHVHAGVHSTIVHTLPLEEPIRRGEVIHVDFGACFAGYYTDLSRNAVVDEASARQETIYRHLWEIEQILIERMTPGASAREIFELAEREFTARKLVHPWGTLGHSTGLAVHEGFELSRAAEDVLEPGMILNIEPSHIEQGDARYHIEDSVLVTEDGCEVLSNFGPTDRMPTIR